MKQTQTKYFDCSDVGLEMCFGAVNKNPGSFKKILCTGYNPLTASSFSIAGGEVTLNYASSHGYVASRVLHVEASGGYSKEVVIDSVTATSVTFTDADTADLTGTINTKIAPLGWDLVYEVGNIHIYKMLHLDDTDRYVRMCFETNTEYRAAIAVCIGKSYDPVTGFINDPNALQSTKDVVSPSAANLPKWDAYFLGSTYANYNYTQGLGRFGHGAFVGSKYHIGFQVADGYMGGGGVNVAHHIFGIFPTHCLDYEVLDYPLLVAMNYNSAGWNTGNSYGNFSRNSNSRGHGSIGNIRVRLDFGSATEESILHSNASYPFSPLSSYVSTVVDTFNTTTLQPFDIYEHTTSQFLGSVYGIYRVLCNATELPPITALTSPSINYSVDFNTPILLCASCQNNANTTAVRVIALPVEPIKYVSD